MDIHVIAIETYVTKRGHETADVAQPRDWLNTTRWLSRFRRVPVYLDERDSIVPIEDQDFYIVAATCSFARLNVQHASPA